MAANQQFCLRWNNHQRTLISVFDSLLESGTLVDCTLAAEGQYLKAHKVVLSACSPYLGVLLSQHHEKHPILILKDIKFQELKAMLDYMYRGEVNISQEQLCTFLKAAESLQIKGLTESAGLNPETKDFEERLVKRYDRKCPTAQIPNHSARTRSPPSNTVNTTTDNWSQKFSATNFRSNSPPRIRDGSLSPTARKRRKQQHPMPSVEDTGGGTNATSNTVENHQDSSVDSVNDTALNPVSSSNSNSLTMNINSIKTENSDKTVDNERCTDSGNSSTTNSSKTSEPAVIPKTEPKFDDRHSDNEAAYEDSVEEMTIEDEEEEIDENDLSRPGPSHSDDSQNYGSSSYQLSSVNDGSSGQLDSQAEQYIMMNDDSYHWPSIEEGENEFFGMTSSPLKAALSKPPLLQLPDLMQNPTSKSDNASKFITCAKCGRQYKLKSSLLNHQRWECGKEPQFKCVLCNYKAKQKVHLVTHMRYKHALKPDVFSLK